MSALKNNVMFEYLYRDSGNYKTLRHIIFSNNENIRLEDVTSILVKKLIDGEYFYPLEVGVPVFFRNSFNLEENWYEFFRFSLTFTNVNDIRDIKTFLLNLTLYY